MRMSVAALGIAVGCAVSGLAAGQAEPQQAEAERLAIGFLARKQGAHAGSERVERAQFLYAVRGAVSALRLHGLACFPAGSSLEGVATEVAERIVAQSTLQPLDIGAAVAIAAVDKWPCREGQVSSIPR
ncbi:hypothetical protein CS062_17395 [Roseateles chitinivorans]|uniref:Rap1a immunity protein domain-containing protein n=1 Tax=Roseateles chitinivorans TaxID=2917965 RepID=A0A2G9C625_9BURK|nr:hypothetical protein [Roseateles chitinivorans]PIM51900.1 hypothetical protein CS062_17395 [Roseateles chitinivorans]